MYDQIIKIWICLLVLLGIVIIAADIISDIKRNKRNKNRAIYNYPQKGGYRYSISITIFPDKEIIEELYSNYGDYTMSDLLKLYWGINEGERCLWLYKEGEQLITMGRIMKIEMKKEEMNEELIVEA